MREETHIGYSYRLTARVLLYAPSHRQDSTYHGLCYTSRGALAGTRNSSMGPPHDGSIRRPIAPWANALPLSYVPLLAQKKPINHDSSCCDRQLIQHKLSYIKSIFFNRLFLISNIIHPRIGSSSVVRAFAWGVCVTWSNPTSQDPFLGGCVCVCVGGGVPCPTQFLMTGISMAMVCEILSNGKMHIKDYPVAIGQI